MTNPIVTTEASDPDLILVQALMLGKDHALNALMDRHREGLFCFVLRHVHNEADALAISSAEMMPSPFVSNAAMIGGTGR